MTPSLCRLWKVLHEGKTKSWVLGLASTSQSGGARGLWVWNARGEEQKHLRWKGQLEGRQGSAGSPGRRRSPRQGLRAGSGRIWPVGVGTQSGVLWKPLRKGVVAGGAWSVALPRGQVCTSIPPTSHHHLTHLILSPLLNWLN